MVHFVQGVGNNSPLVWKDDYASYRHQVKEGGERTRRMFSRITK